MHFLSHYIVGSHRIEPHFVTGLVMPDLIKGFSKMYNSHFKRIAYPVNEHLLQLHMGVIEHYETDKNFHNSAIFMQHVATIIQSFINTGLDRQKLRLSFIAHLTLELMIDRCIILEDDKVCSEFYSTLDKVDEMVLRTYLRGSPFVTTEQIFLTNFQIFRQNRFLARIEDLGSLVQIVERIYGSVTKVRFSKVEKMKILAAVSNIDSKLRYSWVEILKI